MDTGRVVLYIATSVDGFIADEDGGVEWLDEFQPDSAADDDGVDADEAEADGADADGGYEEFFGSIEALVMGARTYERVRSFGEWPYEDRPTYVLTHGEGPPDIDTVEFVRDDIEAISARLTERYGRIWLVGGGETARAFFAAGRVDELRVSVVPLLLGSGVRLFGENGTRERLTVVDSTTRENGIVELGYAVD